MTSQMTKDFSLKSKLRKFADGGGLQRRPFEPVVGTNSPLPGGGGGGLSREAVAAAQPRPQPQAQPAAQPKSGVGALPADYLRKPASALRAREQTAGLADGGSKSPSFLDRARQALGGRSRQIEGAVDAASGAPAPRPAPAPAPQPAPRPVNPDATPENPAGIKFADGGDMDEAAMLALANGGKVKGKGGPTDDEVGPVMLSDEEYVIPADTADAIGRDKLDALRLATHEFKDPKKESALRKTAVGLRDGGSTFYTDQNGRTTTPAGASGAQRLPPPQAPLPGGPSINVGADGTARMSPPPGANVPATQPPQMGQRPPIDVTPRGTAPVDVTPRGPAAAVTDVVAKTAPSPLAKVGGFAKGLIKGGAPIGQAMGAYDATMDASNGYREDFQKRMGVETPLGSVGADLLRTGAGMADSALMGLPGRLGRGIAGLIGEGEDAFKADGIGGALSAMGRNVGHFAKGFMSDSDRDTFLQNKAATDFQAAVDKAKGPAAPPAAPASALRSDQGPALPVPEESYQSRRLSEMGVPVDVQNSKPVIDSTNTSTRDFLKTGGTGEFQNLGSYGGNGNIYGKASDPSKPGRINSFVGVGAGASPENAYNGSGSGNNYGGAPRAALPTGERASALRAPAPRSNADQINKNYDAMAKSSGGAVVKGLGWAQRHGLSIENARQGALREDAQNQTALRGQDITAETSRGNNATTAETSRINAQAVRDSSRMAAQTAAAERALTREAAAETRAQAREDKGFARMDDMIKGQFTGAEGLDNEGMSEFKSFMGSGNAMVGEGKNKRPLLSLGAQEQMQELPKLLEDFKANRAINEVAKRGSMLSNGAGGVSSVPQPLELRESEFGDMRHKNLPVLDYLASKLGDNRVVVRGDQAARYSDVVPKNNEDRRRSVLRNLVNGK